MAKGSGKGKKDDKSKKDEKPEKDKDAKKDEKAQKGAASKKGAKSKKADKSKKGAKSKKDVHKRSRFSPIKTPVHASDIKEVSALRAFLASFIMFSLILAPVLGLGMYFGRSALIDIFPTPEEAFLFGMALGLLVSFVLSIVFTRKAVATA